MHYSIDLALLVEAMVQQKAVIVTDNSYLPMGLYVSV